MNIESLVEQLRDWAEKLTDVSSTPKVVAEIEGVMAGMRQVADDLEKELNERPTCPKPVCTAARTWPSEGDDDGERLECAECGQSFNVNDSGSETLCTRCSVRQEDANTAAEDCTDAGERIARKILKQS